MNDKDRFEKIREELCILKCVAEGRPKSKKEIIEDVFLQHHRRLSSKSAEKILGILVENKILEALHNKRGENVSYSLTHEGVDFMFELERDLQSL